MRLRSPRVLLALLLLAALLAVSLFPWQTHLESRLIAALEAQGFRNVHLHVAALAPQSLTLDDIALTGDKFSATAPHLRLVLNNLQFLQGQGAATWQIDKLQLDNLPLTLPPLNGNGTLTLLSARLALEGQLASANQDTTATFEFNAPRDPATQATLKLRALKMPWSQGTLAANDVLLPLDSATPIQVKLRLRNIDLSTLMQQLTSKPATATGAISGTLPLTINPDGRLDFHQGSLQADGPGAITLPPDVIPGDNPQVALARDILKDFHYKLLTLSVSSDPAKKLILQLQMEGNNPNVAAGRPVKLNVRLTGDVLNLIQQNLTVQTNAQKLLEQAPHAKP